MENRGWRGRALGEPFAFAARRCDSVSVDFPDGPSLFGREHLTFSTTSFEPMLSSISLSSILYPPVLHFAAVPTMFSRRVTTAPRPARPNTRL